VRARRRLAVFASLFLLAILLTAGLWPFHIPRNQVSWIPDRPGLRLGARSTLGSTASLDPLNSASCTVELWLRPKTGAAIATLLAFYGPSGIAGISFHQSLTDLRLDRTSPGRTRDKRYIENVLRSGKVVFFTVVSTPTGTAVYRDGKPLWNARAFRPDQPDCAGHFVVGDSPVEDDGWEGDLYGLAVYHRELSSFEITASHRAWMADNGPSALLPAPDVLYRFTERRGSVVHSLGIANVSLSIPAKYGIARPTLLASPWKPSEEIWDDYPDIFLNIAGFVPFGFTMSVLFALLQRKDAARLALLSGVAVSAAIEILQFWLPTRNSDSRDILTNGFGTAIGVFLYRRFIRWRPLPDWSSHGSHRAK